MNGKITMSKERGNKHERLLSRQIVPSFSYSSDKTVPWNYGGDVYYHGVKQDWLADEDSIFEKADPDISNIVGTTKITRSGRVFSLEIAPPKTVTGLVIIPAFVPTTTIPMVTPNDTPTVVPQNFPSRIWKNMSSEVLKLLKEVQELTRQTLS